MKNNFPQQKYMIRGALYISSNFCNVFFNRRELHSPCASVFNDTTAHVVLGELHHMHIGE